MTLLQLLLLRPRQPRLEISPLGARGMKQRLGAKDRRTNAEERIAPLESCLAPARKWPESDLRSCVTRPAEPDETKKTESSLTSRSSEGFLSLTVNNCCDCCFMGSAERFSPVRGAIHDVTVFPLH